MAIKPIVGYGSLQCFEFVGLTGSFTTLLSCTLRIPLSCMRLRLYLKVVGPHHRT